MRTHMQKQVLKRVVAMNTKKKTALMAGLRRA